MPGPNNRALYAGRLQLCTGADKSWPSTGEQPIAFRIGSTAGNLTFTDLNGTSFTIPVAALETVPFAASAFTNATTTAASVWAIFGV